MSKQLHVILAAEGDVTKRANDLVAELGEKFSKSPTYFHGEIKTLKMLEDSPGNQAIEAQARVFKPLTTSVKSATAWALKFWAQSENLQEAKAVGNSLAKADLIVGGAVLATNLTVDQLLGLSHRLKALQRVLSTAPTLDLARSWTPTTDAGDVAGAYKSDAQITTKPEKTVGAVTLAPATDKHPAQVKEISIERILGKFESVRFSGELTSAQKANLLANLDALITATKEARQRANSVEIPPTQNVGDKVVDFLMASLDTPV